MLLTAMERIFVLELLANYKNDYEGLKQLRVDRECLSINQEEGEEIGTVRNPDGTIGFNPAKADAIIKEVPLSEFTTSIIRKDLSEMEKKKELSDHLVSIFEKFVVAYKA